MCDTYRKHKDGQTGCRGNETEEIGVVAFGHTVANPWAMVIELLNTAISVWAVGSPRRPEDMTSVSVLQLEQCPTNWYVPINTVNRCNCRVGQRVYRPKRKRRLLLKNVPRVREHSPKEEVVTCQVQKNSQRP
jgi:hypothetical protein